MPSLVSSTPEPAGGAPGPLLERARELAAIDALLARAADGRGQLAVVEGAAGIGKTTLLRAAEALARDRGLTVLSARGSPLERDFSYGVVRGLFEPFADEPALLAGAAGLAERALNVLAGGDGRAREEVSAATLHGLYWLSANIASRSPAVLCVDDGHWADAASLRFLAYLGARLEGLPVLVLVAVRSGEPAVDPELLREVGALSTVEPIRPAALGAEAAATLIRDEFGDTTGDRFCRACHTATGGNPLLLRTLAASFRNEGRQPTDEAATSIATFGVEAVGRSIAQQLARLPAGSTPFLHALSILGSDAPLRHLAGLAGLELAEAIEITDALRDASILAPGDELDFAHPILGSAIANGMAPGERALAHVRAAELLAADGASPDRLALHLLHTHPSGDPAVAETLRCAAALAADRGAPDIAATYLRRALEEPPPPSLRAPCLLELGLAQLAVRADAEAIPRLVEAVAASAPAERAATAQMAGRAVGLTGRFEQAAEMLEAALDGAPRTDAEALVEAELLGHSWLLAPRVPSALERLARHEPDDLPAGPARELMLVHHAVRELRQARPAAAGWELLDRALATGDVLRQESIVLAWIMVPLMWTDRFDETEQISSALVAEVERRGAAYLAAHLSFPRAFADHRRGRLRQAEADARWGMEQKLPRGIEGTVWHLVPLVEALVDQGDLEGAELALATVGVPERPKEQLGWALVLEARGRLRLAQGRPEKALDDLLEAGRRWERFGWTHPGLMGWRNPAAEALVALGERAEAARLAAEQLDLSRASALPRPIGVATLAAATAAPRGQDMLLLREAVVTLEQTPARLELARAHVALGAALRREGKRIAAREHLRRGLELAHRTGARPLAARAHEELVAAGARPRRPVFTGVDALTASELRVARLAADGLTNREVAERLFVTDRTVETHLRHAFQKLDIRGRNELTGVLTPGEQTP